MFSCSNASVCAFDVEIDGVVTKCVVQEKTQARATYDAAIAAGDGAQLLEQQRPDVFHMHVGNLMPGQACTVSIT
jgi:Ca-activated chloride channel family protein